MKEENSNCANGRNCPSPVLESIDNIRGLLEDIKERKLDYLTFLIEAQSLMLRDATESQYSVEHANSITSCIHTIQHLVLDL